MNKEQKEDVIEKRKDIDELLEKLDVAIKKEKKDWIKVDIIRLVAQLAIMGKKADIGLPSEILGDADRLIDEWKAQKEKKRHKYHKVVQSYNKWADTYDTTENLAIIVDDQIKSWFDVKNKGVLDLGCGTGRYSLPLAKNNSVTAVDFSDGMLRIAKNKAKKAKVNIDFSKGDITRYNPQKKFDIIISMLVQDHIKNLGKVVNTIEKASKIGTEVIITNIHPNFTFKTHLKGGKFKLIEGVLTNQYYHPLEEYLKFFRKKGFELVDYKDLIQFEKYFANNKFLSLKSYLNKPIVAAYKFKRLR